MSRSLVGAQPVAEIAAADEGAVDTGLRAFKARALKGNELQGEVYLRTARTRTVEVKDGAIENVLSRGERGIGVRVLDGERAGFSYTSDLTPAGIEACVDRAQQMARAAGPDPDLRIASEPIQTEDLGLYEPGIERRSLEERTAVALETERAARAADPRITGFRKTTAGDEEETRMVATTAGVRAAFRETSFWCGTSAIASADSDRQIGYHAEAARRFDDLSPASVGRIAAERAAGKLGARTVPTQRIPIVLDPWMAMQLLGALSPLFSAENVLKGKSLFAGKLGQPVASRSVTIVDDGRRRGGMRTSPFDGEGVRTSRRVLVQDGALRAYLTSLKTARKLGERPGGNARRGSYAGLSRIGPSNLYIEAGNDDPVAVVGGLDRALAITSLLNLHTIDPISGEFSLGATGHFLERGERAYPAQGLTIAGNLTALLTSIIAVGDDLIFGPSGVGSPTLVVAEVSVGGT